MGISGTARLQIGSLSVWLVVVIASIASVIGQENSDTIKPLPKNLSSDKYESRESFLRQAAAFELERLRSRPWGYDGVLDYEN